MTNKTETLLFQDLNLEPALVKAVDRLGFQSATPIQSQTLPVLLKGRDLIGCAETGSGKTGAFSIPAITHLMKNEKSKVLILVPTRELATQVEKSWMDFSRFAPPMNIATIVGGLSYVVQYKKLAKNPRVIIATPGRLNDLLEQKKANLSQVDYLVLDEADRMLDMGFTPQVERILKHLPTKRQTVLFSATWDARLDQLTQKYLHQPVKISVGQESQAAKTVQQEVKASSQEDKKRLLLQDLQDINDCTLVFSRTKRSTDRLAQYLNTQGIACESIHGDKTQGRRNRTLSDFREGRIQVLIATDVASRGLDVKNINTVINFDLPDAPEDYIHRIGRTGRAGASGRAVSYISPDEHDNWASIVNILKKSGSTVPVLEGFVMNAPRSSQGARSRRRRPGQGGGRFSPNRGRSRFGERPQRSPQRSAQRSPQGSEERSEFRPDFRSGQESRPFRSQNSDNPSFGNRSEGSFRNRDEGTSRPFRKGPKKRFGRPHRKGPRVSTGE